MNVVVSLIFLGMFGLVVVDVVGIGKIIIDMMVKSGCYICGYVVVIIVVIVIIGFIIFLFILMVFYVLVLNEFVGVLFLVGIVLGLVMGVVLMGMNFVILYWCGFG